MSLRPFSRNSSYFGCFFRKEMPYRTSKKEVDQPFSRWYQVTDTGTAERGDGRIDRHDLHLKRSEFCAVRNV